MSGTVLQTISDMEVHSLRKINKLRSKYSETTLLTLQPNDEQACSMISKIYQCYWHSTNHSRSFDQQNATFHQPSLEMSGTSSRKKLAKLNGLVSAIKVCMLGLSKI
jgi:hypothetical protein